MVFESVVTDTIHALDDASHKFVEVNVALKALLVNNDDETEPFSAIYQQDAQQDAERLALRTHLDGDLASSSHDGTSEEGTQWTSPFTNLSRFYDHPYSPFDPDHVSLRSWVADIVRTKRTLDDAADVLSTKLSSLSQSHHGDTTARDEVVRDAQQELEFLGQQHNDGVLSKTEFERGVQKEAGDVLSKNWILRQFEIMREASVATGSSENSSHEFPTQTYRLVAVQDDRLSKLNNDATDSSPPELEVGVRVGDEVELVATRNAPDTLWAVAPGSHTLHLIPEGGAEDEDGGDARLEGGNSEYRQLLGTPETQWGQKGRMFSGYGFDLGLSKLIPKGFLKLHESVNSSVSSSRDVPDPSTTRSFTVFNPATNAFETRSPDKALPVILRGHSWRLEDPNHDDHPHQLVNENGDHLAFKSVAPTEVFVLEKFGGNVGDGKIVETVEVEEAGGGIKNVTQTVRVPHGSLDEIKVSTKGSGAGNLTRYDSAITGVSKESLRRAYAELWGDKRYVNGFPENSEDYKVIT